MLYDYIFIMESTLIKMMVPEYIFAHFEEKHAERISGVFCIYRTEKRATIDFP